MNNQPTTGGSALDQDSFDQLNQEGAAKVAAITPTSDPLSSADEQLLMQVAMGGMMQLEVSEAALDFLEDDDVLALAEAEVDEQLGISEKLEEIAAAKGVSLPEQADPQTEELIAALNTADDADAHYVSMSGVQGHQKLLQTMTMVKQQAQDPTLLALAEATLPVIQAHLQTAQMMQGPLS
jgi:putative membrane protein